MSINFNYDNPARGDYLKPGYAEGRAAYIANIHASNEANRAAGARRNRIHRRLVNVGKLATVMGAGAGAWAPAVFGTGSAAAAGAAAGGSTAAKVGLGTRLGRIFSSTGFETGANVGLGLYGMRQSNKANDLARQATLDYQTKQIELEQQRLAQEAENATLDRAERLALNTAIQALEQKKFTLQQESMVFERENALFNRRITEKNEGVKDRYRTSIGEPAQQRLARMVGL